MALNLTLPIPELLASVAPVIDESIESLVPRCFGAETLQQALGKPRFDFDAQALTHALCDPIWHVLDAGGKRWRPALMLVTAAAFECEPELVVDLAAMCELIHNGTLIVDDIEDDSAKRRGRDAAHVAFGLDLAINAGNMLYFLPLHAVLREVDLPEGVRLEVCCVVVEEMARLHAGQAMDIAWHRGFRVPTVEQYLQMCAFKTGTLARMAVRIAAAVAQVPRPASGALGRYAESIGVGFQIQDDILNVSPSALAEGKGFGDDIHEGKITLMVLHALQHSSTSTGARLLGLLRSHTADPVRIREAVDLLVQAGSVDYARGQARRIVEEAWQGAAPFVPDNPAGAKLGEFAEFLTTRDI